MDNRQRQAAFKAAMRSKGFVAATEWVPGEHRELFRAVARALREGQAVSIGTGNAAPDQGTEDRIIHVEVTPVPVEDRIFRPKVVIEPCEKRVIHPNIVTGKKAEPVTLEPKASDEGDERKRKHLDRQARYAELWDNATEPVQMIDPNGKGHEARVTERRTEYVAGMLGDRTRVQWVSGVIKKGNQFQKLEFSVWDNVGIRMRKPTGWSVVPVDMIAIASRRVRELHPDKGGPGGDEFKAALAELNALRGRV